MTTVGIITDFLAGLALLRQPPAISNTCAVPVAAPIVVSGLLLLAAAPIASVLSTVRAARVNIVLRVRQEVAD